MDDTGRSKGYAFVHFHSVDDAQKAMSKLNGLELAGMPLKVGLVNETNSANPAMNTAAGSWKLDDDEGSGMQMDAQARASLMSRLGGGAGLETPAASAGMSAMPAAALVQPLIPVAAQQAVAAGGKPVIAGTPSFQFVLKNMFNPEEEAQSGESDWDVEIKEDVEEECSKFGAILHAYVEKEQPGGLVYLMFSTVSAAQQAADSLNGRWFAGRMITVRFMGSQEYVGKFPEAKQVLSCDHHCQIR